MKEFMRDDCRVMSSHKNLFAGTMRFYLDTINYIRPCLKNGKTPSLGIFFR